MHLIDEMHKKKEFHVYVKLFLYSI